jgi:SDR family mycofactocin-dependent oxidoreductase
VSTQRLTGKVALVTGAARGQGRSHAARLAAEGADIIAVDVCRQLESVAYPMATTADFEETVAAVEATGRKIAAYQADVRDLGALQVAVDSGVSAFGRLDVVVANAGIASYAPALELSELEFDEMVAVNLGGVWRTVRASVPHIKAGGEGGSVVITSSASGLRGIPNAAHYAAAKHGLVGLMKVLALEFGRDRIRVNTIHPTTVDTPMVQNDATLELFLPGRPDKTPEAFARIAQQLNVIPVPWIQPETVSDLVVFLASDDAQYITGAAIPVDAGMAIRW